MSVYFFKISQYIQLRSDNIKYGKNKDNHCNIPRTQLSRQSKLSLFLKKGKKKRRRKKKREALTALLNRKTRARSKKKQWIST